MRIAWMQPRQGGESWSPVVAADGSDRRTEWACWHGNLLAQRMPAVESWPSRRAIVRSGSLAEGDDPFVEDPRHWMPVGRRALEEACDRLVGPLAESGGTLLLRPHVRQVLSDVAGAADFLRRHRGERFGLALAPADLITGSMLPRAEDLLVRTFEMLVPRLDPQRDVLILGDLLAPEHEEELPRLAPLGEGVLPWASCRRFAHAIPADLPILLDAGTDPQAMSFLAG
jgi:hypothetical protein